MLSPFLGTLFCYGKLWARNSREDLEAFHSVNTAGRGIDEVARMAARIKLKYEN